MTANEIKVLKSYLDENGLTIEDLKKASSSLTNEEKYQRLATQYKEALDEKTNQIKTLQGQITKDKEDRLISKHMKRARIRFPEMATAYLQKEYDLEIRNYRNGTSIFLLVNYIDSIVLAPTGYMLGADGVTFCCTSTTTRSFELNAGPAFGNKEYWLWMGLSDTYPGMYADFIHIPLNYDRLVAVCFMNPGFGGMGFIGQLDAGGRATASMTMSPDMNLLGLTVYFAYVVFPPGGPALARC